MTKISYKKIPADKVAQLRDQLWRAITLLENKDEVRKFFYDILTRTEIQMLAKRLEIVKMLHDKSSYIEIRKALCVTDSTIAKISNWNDAFGQGYKIILERLEKINSKSKVNKSSIFVHGKVKAAQQAWVGAGTEMVRLYKQHRKRNSPKY